MEWIGPLIIEKKLGTDQYELVDAKGKNQGRWSAGNLKSAIHPIE